MKTILASIALSIFVSCNFFAATEQPVDELFGFKNKMVPAQKLVETRTTIYAINSGSGPMYLAEDRTIFRADDYYLQGTPWSRNNSIDLTNDDTLYQTERYGDFSYYFPVETGIYDVTLKFAEIYFEEAGGRLFNVSIEEEEVLSSYDLFSEAGLNIAHDLTFRTIVNDGHLDINFLSVINNAKVSAVLVEKIDLMDPNDIEEPAEGPFVYAINAGGDEYLTPDETIYDADRFFDVGSASDTSNPIAGTFEQGLYQTERYGNFTYELNVSPGDYEVTLKFAETYHNGAGMRIFDVLIEGQEVISDFDIYAEVGKDQAVDKTFNVSVSDGSLDITFNTDVDNAKVSAILVKRL